VLLTFILDIVSNIISGEVKMSGDYVPLLPANLQKYFSSLTLNNFVFLGLILIFFYAFFAYFVNL